MTEPLSPPPTTPDAATVEGWIAAVRRELLAIGQQIEPLLMEQNRLRTREQILGSLLRTINPQSQSTVTPQSAIDVAISPLVVEGSMRDYVRDGVRAVLTEAAGPLHINDLHARFIARGLRVPGAGRPANLTAHLGRCPGIVSPQRGIYALAVTNGVEVTAKHATSKRRHGRRKSKK